MFWFGALSLPRVLALAPYQAEASALRIAGALSLASAALWPLLQTGVALDDPGAALDPEQVAIVLGQTSFGRLWLARELLLAAAVVLGMWRPQGRLVYLLAGGALASLALLGHAAGVEGRAGWGQQLVLALHLLAAGAWLGALPPLWQAARGTLPGAALAKLLRGFSGYGIKLVALVVLSGSASVWWRTGGQVFGPGAYRRILLAKLALVLCMGAAALLNRNRYTPALDAARGSAAATAPAEESAPSPAVRPETEPEPVLGPRTARRGLVASIGTEMALGAAVVLLAFVLGAAEAPY